MKLVERSWKDFSRMRSLPLVSIKIASYNHGQFIGKAIQSVLDQSYTNFELIIIDDCSTDNSLDVIESFRDPRIQFIVNERNIGAASSSSRAKSLCTGKYFCSLDSDDYFHPDKVASQVTYLETNPQVGLIATHIQEVDIHDRPDMNPLSANWFNTHNDLSTPECWIWQNRICHSSVMLKKTVHDQFWDYGSGLLYTNDWNNWIRMLSAGIRIGVIPEKLTYYRRHPGNTTFKNPERTLWEYAYISAQTLHPYLKRTDRNDLLHDNFERFLIDDRYPSDLAQRFYFLHLLLTHHHPDFEQIWKQRNLLDLSTICKFPKIDELKVIEELRLQLAASHSHLNSLKEELRLAENKTFKLARLRNVWNYERLSLNKLSKLAYILFQSFIPDVLKWVLQPVYKLILRHVLRKPSPKLAPYIAHVPSPLRQHKRILHVIANFMTGGSSQLVVDIMERLGEGYEQQVLTAHIPSSRAYKGIPIHEYRGEQEIKAFVTKFDPDLVHIHYWGGDNWVWYDKVFRVAEQTGCKVIENVNTPVAPYRSTNIRKYVYVSEYVSKNFGRSGESSEVIYPGTDTNFYALNEPDRKSEDPCLGMVYRLEPDKLNEQAIDVFIEVVRLRPMTRVLVIGDGKLLPIYRNKVAGHGIEKAFSFAGAKSYAELPTLYSRMDIFVAPVWKESFGQVSCFAMSMGIPVVGYKVGGLQEIVGNDDLLVTPGDSKALATLIISLLDDPSKRKAIGERNRQRAHALFSLDRMIEKYADLYNELTQA